MSAVAFDVVTDVAADAANGPGGSPSGSIVFLHGILGSRTNWMSFAKKLVQRVPRFRAVVVDLRGHGASHGFAPPHTVAACARDLLAADAVIANAAVVVGHSFGGKVALSFAQQRAQQGTPLQQVWSLDCPPGTRLVGGVLDRENDRVVDDVARVLDAVRSVPMPVPSRAAMVAHLAARGLSPPLCQWMTTNLRSEGDAFVWKFDLDVVDGLLRDFVQLDVWDVVEARTAAPTAVHMVRAGRGARFLPADSARLAAAAAAGACHAHVMENAGHWLHTDDPEGLLALLVPALSSLVPQ